MSSALSDDTGGSSRSKQRPGLLKRAGCGGWGQTIHEEVEVGKSFFGGGFFVRVFIVFIVVMFEPSWEIWQTSQLLKDFDSCKLQDMRRTRFATTFYVTKKQDASLPARSMPLASPCCLADVLFSSSVGDATLTWGRRPGCLPDDWCQGVSWISKICVEIASMLFSEPIDGL